MKIELNIDNELKRFESLKELRKFLLSFKTIPQVKKLIINGKSISYFQICYFIAHGFLPC